ncbi:MAG: DNA mismatch repair endonuclease MutL [Ruminococcus sp.]|nr:DNA mismatch repair endonuclease MutL [Ruminococcus sp.]
MAKINLLKREISELIAAGEVIDRPASVIKELLENSIDSGADVITVEIKNGGRTYMRITDNGCGIAKNELPTAFLRHATSKISEKSDLDSILTLGFRGEALASVAAVSKVDIISKMPEEQFGAHYSIEGSEEKILEDSGCQNGTTIIVRDIFYNVPARLKFLKKDVTEGNSVAAIVNKIAISHPEISFKFIRDNKTELLTAGDGKLYSAIYAVFGKEFAKTLVPVDYTSDGIHVTGYISKPLESKAKRNFQNFYINNRYIKSVTCMVALEEAYKNQIMTGKFPACILCLDIPPNLIDVNVHPTKIEVRFSDERMIYNSVYFAVKNALLLNDGPTQLNVTKTRYFSDRDLYKVPESEQGTQIKFDLNVPVEKPKPVETPVVKPVYNPVATEIKPKKNITAEEYNRYVKEISAPVEPVISEKATEYIEKDMNPLEDEQVPDIKEIIPPQPVEIPTYELSEKKTTENEISIIEEEVSEYKYINTNSFVKKEVEKRIAEKETEKPRLVGEVFRTYIIVEYEKEMYLIDKHAAHERFIFEKIKKREKKLSVQMFIEPIIVMLSFEEYDAIMENLDTVTDLGFAIEDDVAPGVAVLGIPSVIEGTNPNDIIPELAENFLQCKNDPQLDLIDELFHSIACKSAIKANDYNDSKELQKLIDMVFFNEEIRYCPHGRPVMIKLTKRDIEKQFRRVL